MGENLPSAGNHYGDIHQILSNLIELSNSDIDCHLITISCLDHNMINNFIRRFIINCMKLWVIILNKNLLIRSYIKVHLSSEVGWNLTNTNLTN